MPTKYLLLSIVALAGPFFQTPGLLAQDAQGDQEVTQGPRIFFDCQGSQCGSTNDTYYRTEIPWVTWVRDQQDANLYLIMTSQTTGGGGREFQLDAVGREQYADYEDQSFFRSLATDTQRENVDGISHSLGLAFARFAQYAGFRDLVHLEGNQIGNVARQTQIVTADQANDPWNLWVFNVSGNGNFNGEATSTTRRFSGSLSASRVTPTWKQSYRSSVNYNFQETNFSSGAQFKDVRTDWNFNTTVVYTVAEFWSAGFTGRAGRSVRQNQRFSARISPALEYSLLPYDEATRRAVTAFYEIGPVYYDYFELTEYELIEETRFEQSLTLEVSARQPWGDVSLTVAGSHYLHDFDRNNLRVSGNVSFRITRGLDVNFGGSYSLVADQLYLPFEELTDEELLSGVRSAATDQRHTIILGLSYRFGSIFNNVVNNRFPGGGGNSRGFPGGGGFRLPPGFSF